jgi:hypothetical protein
MQWSASRWDRKAAQIISGQPLFAVFAVFTGNLQRTALLRRGNPEIWAVKWTKEQRNNVWPSAHVLHDCDTRMLIAICQLIDRTDPEQALIADHQGPS